MVEQEGDKMIEPEIQHAEKHQEVSEHQKCIKLNVRANQSKRDRERKSRRDRKRASERKQRKEEERTGGISASLKSDGRRTLS